MIRLVMNKAIREFSIIDLTVQKLVAQIWMQHVFVLWAAIDFQNVRRRRRKLTDTIGACPLKSYLKTET